MRRTAISWVAGALALAGVALAHPAAADTAWLGVYSQEITSELREGLNYNGSGALVTRVVPDSPADRAGIERGDVITQVGSHDVDSPSDLADAVHGYDSGRTADVTVVRDGSKRSLRVTFEARSGGDSDNDNDRTFEIPVPPSHVDRDAPDAPEAPPAPRAPRARMHGDSHDGDHDFMMRMPDMSGMGMGMGMGMRGRLGVRIQSLSGDLGSYFGGVKGVLVLDVTDGSAAEKAGIRAGDVITRVNDRNIDDADELIEAVRSLEGDVTIALQRHGERTTVHATLEAAPRTMRFRNNGQGFDWKSDDGKSWQFEGPGSNGNLKRIIINGDGDNDNDDKSTAPRRHVTTYRSRGSSDSDMDAMREEIRQLKEQLEDMRKQLNEK